MGSLDKDLICTHLTKMYYVQAGAKHCTGT